MFKCADLAKKTIRFLVIRKTGESPSAESYLSTMIQHLAKDPTGSRSKDVITHATGRIARGESRCTIDEWIDAHAYCRRYKVETVKMREHLVALNLKPEGGYFTHCPSDNPVKSDKLGRTYGPHKPSLPGNPGKSNDWKEPEQQVVIDYVKTDKIVQLAESILSMSALGKESKEDDSTLSRRLYGDLVLEIATLGGVQQ